MTIMRGSFLAFALLCGRALSFPLARPISSPTFTRSSSDIRAQGITAAWGTATATLEADAVGVDADELEALGIHIPFGLRQTLLTNAHQAISMRFWIVDNSGSMNIWDGHQVSVDHGDHNAAHCTRWCEVQETVNCHAQLSAALGAPTDFRLLNPPKNGGNPLLRGPQKFRVGYGLHNKHNQKQVVKDCKRAQSIMLRNEPTGRTPLPASIKEVRRDILRMLPQLEAEGSKVCIVIATDGCNYNAQNVGLEVNEEERQQELVQALEMLQGLPVCVVIRLCTDYEPLVAFYNDLDEHLEGVDIDVLDDHMAEAEEVHEYNPWLNYALVLHRMREMGQDCRLFDLLDERPFTQEEVRDFCVLLFGSNDLRHGDWESFLEEVDHLQRTERKQWNPKTKAMAPWIDIKQLASVGEYL